ncbi:MAG: group 1 glycosyl transferase [Chitinophagaceae bacterium]|nr:MAG: group 1 glycosyl transferase [Chitinophagaceae bacterium]
MIKGRDIVVVGQQPWDVEIGSNCKNIALEFSKHNRVLYVNSPLDRITAWKNKHDQRVIKRANIVAGKEAGLIELAPGFWNLYPNKMIESINWIGSQWVFEMLNKLNNKRFAESIQNAIQQLGFKDIILFNDNDMFRCFHLKQLLKPTVSVYYSRDFMLAVDYWKKHGVKLEPELIAQSDVCVANSTYLADYCKKYNPQSYYVGQGCELEIFTGFSGKEKPIDMQTIASPIIGYVGALLGLRLDIDILVYIAKTKPEWNIVLVGPEDDTFKLSELHLLPNVYFLGSKAPDQLPQYINAFDICLNPQILSEVTVGNYPRKIDEYLAMGKPVVATSTPFMEAIFSAHTYLGKNGKDYVTLISKALEENNDEKQAARVAFASGHTWENSVGEIYKAIETVMV